MKKNSTYMTRALKSRDPRYATILGKLGYNRGDLVAAARKSKSSVVKKEIEKFHQRRADIDQTIQQEHDQAITLGSVQHQLETQQHQEEDLTSLRAKYKEVLGKQPYHGWDEETLRQKIKEA